MARSGNNENFRSTLAQSALGAAFTWRDMAFLCMICPIVTIILMSLVPESPAWLVSKGRIRDAERSLQWLRGWVGPEDIKDELDGLVTYVKETQEVKTEHVDLSNGEFIISPKSVNSWKTLLEPDVLVSLRIVSIFFIISNCVSLTAMQPFFIEIFINMQLTTRPEMLNLVYVVIQTLGTVSLAVGVKLAGKRPLSLLSTGICTLMCLGLAACLWTDVFLPWIPIVLFGLSYFWSHLGVRHIPWILLTELFPLRARGLTGGLMGAFSYLTMFLMIKLYYTMAALMGVAGVCFVYGVVGLMGIIYLYWDLPETEGVALEDIERMLSERRAARSQRR